MPSHIVAVAMPSHIVAVAMAALICSSTALSIRNKHVGDFRLFSEPGCWEGNLGVWTVIDDDITYHPCQEITGSRVHSINVTDVIPACKLYLYEDADCKVAEKATEQGQCYDSSQGWKAWKMTC